MLARMRAPKFRAPGLRPGTRVGPLGPFRGRLGLAWFLAALTFGLLILIAGLVALQRL